MKLYDYRNRIFIGDERINSLMNKAVEVVLKHTDFETVSQALDSTDSTLQYWGLKFWRIGKFQSRDSQPNAWLSLLPKVKNLATMGNVSVRSNAVESLREYPQFKSFLAERLTVETDAYIVRELLNLDFSKKAESSAQFNPYLLRFLNHPDKEVRQQALIFIGSNHYSAPVWQVTFDKSVADKVLKMTKSPDEEERKIALFALEGMQKKPTQNQPI